MISISRKSWFQKKEASKEQSRSPLWSGIIAFLLIVAILIWWQVFYLQASSNQIKVYFFDVGQGDAIMIDFGQGEQALIDGGPNRQILSCLGQALPFNDRKIEHLILTHPDADHLGGFLPVIDRYQIGRLYHTGVEHTSQLYQRFKEKIKEKNIDSRIVKVDDLIRPENNPQVKLKIIYPLESTKGEEVSNLNDSSIISLLDTGKIEFLLTGDAEKEVWQELRNKLPKAEILKISHHGATNGTDEILLEETDPEIAVISVGKKNSYGHPTGSVLALLEQFKIITYRTDQQGTVTISTDGEEYWVEGEY